jgi:alkylhydroperoxidase family enzyme
VTLLADTHVPDDVYETARAAFTDQEPVDRMMAVVAINGWNRLMVVFRVPRAVAPDG